MINIGIIGFGYWGPNLVRNFYECPGSNVGAVSDLNRDRLEVVAGRYPTITTTTDYRDLLKNSDIDAVAIATPVSTHFDLAMEALKAGKHVLVEKPMTATSEQSLRLIGEARKRDRVLMVDHTFVYTGSVIKTRELIEKKELGDIYYYDSVRVNLGLFQHDVNVIWDLAVHDLSIMDYILPSQPCAVSATGLSHIQGGHENIAYLTLFFEECLIGHIHVNWLAPVKIRRTLIGGSQKMIVYDDLESSEKIKVYDKGIVVDSSEKDVYEMLVGYRTGDMYAPKLDPAEALAREANHFVECVEGGKTPITDGLAGWRVVRIMEAATSSMAEQGRLVELSQAGGEP